MKAVLDANIFVSAVLSARGSPALVLDAWRAGRFALVISPGILEEIGEVLARPRIRRRHQWPTSEIARFLDDLAELATMTPGAALSAATSADPDDDVYLACAVEGQADYVVSGDQHLLSLRTHAGIRILTAAQFLDILEADVQHP
jgi:putative PIN family toxin of toxin-antitoxin system